MNEMIKFDTSVLMSLVVLIGFVIGWLWKGK